MPGICKSSRSLGSADIVSCRQRGELTDLCKNVCSTSPCVQRLHMFRKVLLHDRGVSAASMGRVYYCDMHTSGLQSLCDNQARTTCIKTGSVSLSIPIDAPRAPPTAAPVATLLTHLLSMAIPHAQRKCQRGRSCSVERQSISILRHR